VSPDRDVEADRLVSDVMRSKRMTVEEEVRAFNDRYERALKEQDAETLVASYRDDARILIGGQPVIRGRAAIERVMRAWVKSGPVSTRFETEEVLSGGELVVDIGSTIQASGRGKYVVVHRRGPDGTLRIAIDAASGDE
jgi:ketosteroid isomerase-like protein